MFCAYAAVVFSICCPVGQALVRQDVRFLQSKSAAEPLQAEATNPDPDHSLQEAVADAALQPLLPSEALKLQDSENLSSWQEDETASRSREFVDVGAGCCRGMRDEANGKLWAGERATLADCKTKCTEFENCGAFEYGWNADKKWCFIWSDQQSCLSLDWGNHSCGIGGGNNGVHAYRIKTSRKHRPRVRNQYPTPRLHSAQTGHVSHQNKEASAIWEFEDVGAGCCSGPRVEAHGKLWAGKMPTLADCKAKCQELGNCGAVEYGWASVKHWCFLWDARQACLTLEWGSAACGQGGGSTGVHAYRVKTPNSSSVSSGEDRLFDRWLPIILQEKPSLMSEQNTVAHEFLEFEDGMAGCCPGPRDEANGKLWAGEALTLGDCKTKCIELENCGAVEYGWQYGNPRWCFIWNKQQTCTSLETGAGRCGDGGGNNGVHAYRVKRPRQPEGKALHLDHLPLLPLPHSEQSLSQETLDFLDVGAGCCSGPRDKLHGKLWAGETPTLLDCKGMCRAFENCGAIEYGWKQGNKEWCFIWSKQQECMILDWRENACGVGGGNSGVHAYRVSRSRQIEPSASKLQEGNSQDDTAIGTHDFEDGVAGCCGGARDKKYGKLWAGSAATLGDCKARCREFENCGAVEYGWKADQNRCFIWSNQHACISVNTGRDSCGEGDNSGVNLYKYKSKVEKPLLRDHLIDRFIVVPEHKLLFCYMENVDSYAFNALFVNLSMRYNSSITPMDGHTGWFQNAPGNYGYNITDLENILANDSWHKALFYDDPIERFVTGYKNKCGQRDEDGALVCSRSFGDEDASFDLAVERMSEMDARPGFDPDLKINEHFQRQMSYCGGLRHNLKYYNTVEKLQKDTLRSKVINLLSTVGADYKWIESFDTIFPSKPEVVSFTQNERNTHLLHRVRQYLPPEKPTLLEKLVQHYKGDYKLFNMSPPRWQDVQGPVLKNHLLDRFFIVPEHKLLFCYMEKVACTNFNNLFAQVRKRYNDSFIATHGSYGWYQSVPYLQGYSIRDLEGILADPGWHKAVFYRDPVERFVSAYRSKCEHVDTDGAFTCNRAFGSKHASFETAVERISRLDARSDFDPDNTMNVHFQRQLSFCGGLEHNLKYYDTVESLSPDTARRKVTDLLDKVGVNTTWVPNFDKLFPVVEKDSDGVLLENQKDHNTDSGSHLQEYLPAGRADLLEKLWKHYEGDYKIFNITLPTWEGKEIKKVMANKSTTNSAAFSKSSSDYGVPLLHSRG